MQPWLGEEEVAARRRGRSRSGWVAQGPRVAAFERAFAAVASRPTHAVAVSQLHDRPAPGARRRRRRAGDEVVVPSFSFIATTNAPTYVGATPVFADVDADDRQPHRPTRSRAALTAAHHAPSSSSTRAACRSTSTRSGPCATRSASSSIEDAACAAGSTYHGRPVGAGAEIAAWSFHPRKLLTTGEGGMITTSQRRLGRRAPARLREHAHERVRRRPARQRARPAGGVRRGRLQLPDDRPAGGGRPGPARPAARDRRPPSRARRAATPGAIAGDRPGCARWPTRRGARRNFQSFWVEVLTPTTRSTATSCWRSSPRPASPPAAASWPPTASRRTPAATHVPLPVTERLTDTHADPARCSTR